MDFQFTPEDAALGMIWYVAFLFSITCHEAAHALAAKLGGDPTAFHGGQVTLNPVPHMQREPFGTILAPLLSFLFMGWMIGWASAPYDPDWQRRYPRRAAWMALAGPAANLVLVLLAAAAIRVGMTLGHFRIPQQVGITQITEATAAGPTEFLATLLSIFFVLNLLLGTFNLLPAPPLDGNTAVTLLMPRRTALRFLDFMQESGYGFLGLLGAWIVYRYIFWYVFATGYLLLYAGAG